jgi:hypothetical protein
MATSPITNCEIKENRRSGVQITIPEGGIQSDHISAVSGQEIVASKLHHRHHKGTNLGFAIGATPTAREEIVYVARGNETIVEFAAMLNADGSSTDIDFVLKKNGSTLMSSDLTITNTTGDRTPVSGLAFLSSVALVANDVLSIAAVVNSSTGAQGPYTWVEIDSTGE